jgi:hypothetical protein
MTPKFVFSIILLLFSGSHLLAQNANSTQTPQTHLYIDVHHLQPGKVSFNDVAAAHSKDLAMQGKYDVRFLKYWVDEKNGSVYCLSEAADTSNIVQTHREAHGLLPHEIYQVSDGHVAPAKQRGHYFLDVHNLGAGKVKVADVEKAHQKDLAIQNKNGVNFINYWVDETKGLVLCLSQASDAGKVVQTHKEAHGLIPDSVMAVKEGK